MISTWPKQKLTDVAIKEAASSNNVTAAAPTRSTTCPGLAILLDERSQKSKHYGRFVTSIVQPFHCD
jgi:hypothetical protein